MSGKDSGADCSLVVTEVTESWTIVSATCSTMGSAVAVG
jgi:hypothetical protein